MVRHPCVGSTVVPVFLKRKVTTAKSRVEPILCQQSYNPMTDLLQIKASFFKINISGIILEFVDPFRSQNSIQQSWKTIPTVMKFISLQILIQSLNSYHSRQRTPSE
jgi:hypothetical protein